MAVPCTWVCRIPPQRSPSIPQAAGILTSLVTEPKPFANYLATQPPLYAAIREHEDSFPTWCEHSTAKFPWRFLVRVLIGVVRSGSPEPGTHVRKLGPFLFVEGRNSAAPCLLCLLKGKDENWEGRSLCKYSPLCLASMWSLFQMCFASYHGRVSQWKLGG